MNGRTVEHSLRQINKRPKENLPVLLCKSGTVLSENNEGIGRVHSPPKPMLHLVILKKIMQI